MTVSAGPHPVPDKPTRCPRHLIPNWETAKLGWPRKVVLLFTRTGNGRIAATVLVTLIGATGGIFTSIPRPRKVTRQLPHVVSPPNLVLPKWDRIRKRLAPSTRLLPKWAASMPVNLRITLIHRYTILHTFPWVVVD